jgi:hypothetical protein
MLSAVHGFNTGMLIPFLCASLCYVDYFVTLFLFVYRGTIGCEGTQVDSTSYWGNDHLVMSL